MHLLQNVFIRGLDIQQVLEYRARDMYGAGRLCVLRVFVPSILAAVPPFKARRGVHFTVGLHLFNVLVCPIRTNRDHTGGGKHRGFFFFLYGTIW